MFHIKSIYLGCFLILAAYHLFVFIGRKKDIINLIYALYCLTLTNLTIASTFFNKYQFIYSYTLYYIISSYHITAGLGGLFTYFIFDLKKTKTAYFFLIYYIFMTISLFFSILFSILIDKNLMYYYLIILTIYSLVFLIFVIWKFIYKKDYLDRKKNIIVIGFFILILFLMIFCILLLLKIKLSSDITYSVFLINALFFAFALTDSFNKEHRDLIDLKDNLEQKVQMRTKQLEEANKQKTDFFINIAHETKTPLTLISNYFDKHLQKHGITKDLDIVKKNIDRLKKDMVNFLDLEKLGQGQVFYNHDKIINLSDLVKQKIILFRDIALKKKIKILLNLEDDIYIKIDPFALDRVINNLIDNAIKFTDLNGKIEVVIKTIDTRVELIVSDTGIGISEEDQKHIFKPYYQISHEKRNIQGIGMGLNIIKKIVDELGGTIEIKSQINKGAMFKIILNKHILSKQDKIFENYSVSQPFNSVTDINLKEGKYNRNKDTILIVEDNIEMLSYLNESFYDDYNVFLSKNGKEALDRINDIPKPNIIISDIMMDDMNGYDFYDELMKKPEYVSIPFIFLTAKTSDFEKIEGLKKGAVDYIYKPFAIDELKSKISSLLMIQKSQRSSDLEEVFIKFSKEIKENYNNTDDMGRYFLIFNKYKLDKVERKIIIRMVKGLEYKEICSDINIKFSVLKKIIHNIYKKLGVKNKFDLVMMFKKYI